MKDKNWEILIFGLGITGISSVKALSKLGYTIQVFDSKGKTGLKESLDALKEFDFFYCEKEEEIDFENLDLVLKSPGIPMDAQVIQTAKKHGIPVMSDLELAQLIWPEKKVIGITGTNGKTTTTTLVGFILKEAGYSVKVAGNIGVGILWEMYCSSKETIYVVEASSFQLESTEKFSPMISAIINITPDHLNWHGTMENYILAKSKIALKQGKDEYCVLNIDDPILSKMEEIIPAKIIKVSQKRVLEEGYFENEGKLWYAHSNKKTMVCENSEIKILGKHNIQNILIAIAICHTFGVDIKIISNSIKKFKGVAHRIEFVREINGVEYYNDSKGTNIDASLKAIEAVEAPIIIIAGGYDKEVALDDFFRGFHDKIKKLILMGETKNIFAACAQKYNFNNFVIVEDLEEAVKHAYEVSVPGDHVLLSPASASWDMYPNFEARGEHFKTLVNSLGIK